MHTKMCIHHSLIRRLANYKVCLCFIVLSVTVCTVGYVCSFRGEQISWILLVLSGHDNLWTEFYIHYWHDV